jgi:ribonucleoside-diphosphate reductase alpha chain
MKDMLFKTSLARENWESKYRYGDEAPLETFERVAKALASVEEEQVRDYWYDKFLRTMIRFDENGNAIGLKNTFGGRITANAGTDYQAATMINCYINGPVSNAKISYKKTAANGVEIPVDIETQGAPDSLANIMLTLLEQAETLKSEGGYGINFGFIRPRGSIIKGIGIKHPGVIHYMDIWDKVAGVIVMGDNDGYKDTLANYLDEMGEEASIKLKRQARKGAQMAVLPIWHPDIEEFVRAKQQPGRLTKFNISVLVNDEFMNAVDKDDFYDLHFNGTVYKRVKARELYDLIMTSTYKRAEPGILFYDNMQANNPLAYLGNVEATNPCGEVPGNPLTTTVCLLGSINLTQYVNQDRTFDWNQLTEDIPVFLRALDNVNDLSYNPLPQYDWATRNVRQVGMGINGLGSAFYMMGIKFNSPEGFEFLENLSYLKEDLLWKSSALLAKEKGKFPAYTDDFLSTNWFTKFNHLSYDTLDLIREHGVRNGKVSMNAPNGNTSIICDITSNGIEPVFMYEYQRTRIVDSWPSGLTKDNVRDVLSETKAGDAVVWKGEYNGQTYYYEPHNRGLCVIEPVRDYGYQWVMDNYPEDIKNNYDYLVTTEGLSVHDHVDSQSIIQRNLSQSVSKTINLPAGYPFEEFKTLYKYAWNKGLIGCTTYVAGSMESVISAVDSEPEEQEQEQEQILDDVIMPAEFYNGETSVVKREGNKFYIHFSYATKNKKRPIAIWINTNTQAPIRHTNQAVNVLLDLARSKGIKQTHIDDVREKIRDNSSNNRLARAVSFCLRHRVPIVDVVLELDRLEEVYVTDLVFAIRKFLSSYVKEGTKIEGRSCSNCGSSNIEFSGGCSTCKDCGSSNCA